MLGIAAREPIPFVSKVASGRDIFAVSRKVRRGANNEVEDEKELDPARRIKSEMERRVNSGS